MLPGLFALPASFLVQAKSRERPDTQSDNAKRPDAKPFSNGVAVEVAPGAGHAPAENKKPPRLRVAV